MIAPNAARVSRLTGTVPRLYCKRLHRHREWPPRRDMEEGQASRTRATLRDVARLAGVHPATASRALNEATRSLVTATTVQRVTAAAAELSYRPNPMARGLRTSRSLTIGVVIPDLTNPLFPPIVRGIEETLDRAGYGTLIANTDNDPARESPRSRPSPRGPPAPSPGPAPSRGNALPSGGGTPRRAACARRDRSRRRSRRW